MMLFYLTNQNNFLIRFIKKTFLFHANKKKKKSQKNTFYLILTKRNIQGTRKN